MFTKSTVIILGAGASFECDMPLGGTLRDEIAKGLNFFFGEGGQLKLGDALLYELLKSRHKDDHKNMFHTARTIAGAARHFPSIDEVLHYFRKQALAVDIGKLAIVYYILGAEANSGLGIGSGNAAPDLGKLHESWYGQFFSLAIAGIDQADITQIFDKVTFINFNYDRTLESK